MSGALVESPADTGAVEIRTSDAPCVVCVTSCSLDNDRPRPGVVRWAVRRQGRLSIGRPIAFDCPNGHSSEDDPALLKAFRSRLF
jgi:hypothetical protein